MPAWFCVEPYCPTILEVVLTVIEIGVGGALVLCTIGFIGAAWRGKL